MIVGLTLVLIATYFAIPTGTAATIDNRKITISDSRPSQAPVTYDFQGDHSGSAVKCLELSFCQSASGACTGPSAMTAASAVKGVSGEWNGWTYANWTATTTFTATRVRYINTTGEAGGSSYSFSTATITNSDTAGTYYARAASYSDVTCGTAVDSGVTAFAIISGVAVSATVPETLTFTIGAVVNGTCDTTFGTFGGPASTATNVAYGEISSTETFYHGCQDLTVSTNANDGYSVTGQETTNLRDTTISMNLSDSLGDSGSMSQTATSAWSTSTNNGFGFACANATGTDCAMTATTWYSQFSCVGSDAQCDPGTGAEAAQSVMSNAAAVSGNASRIQYKLSVSATQAAGSYSNTVVYIATPTY